jgi:hypothetical protein
VTSTPTLAAKIWQQPNRYHLHDVIVIDPSITRCVQQSKCHQRRDDASIRVVCCLMVLRVLRGAMVDQHAINDAIHFII